MVTKRNLNVKTPQKKLDCQTCNLVTLRKLFSLPGTIVSDNPLGQITTLVLIKPGFNLQLF